jgi:hypothetical protein
MLLFTNRDFEHDFFSQKSQLLRNNQKNFKQASE